MKEMHFIRQAAQLLVLFVGCTPNRANGQLNCLPYEPAIVHIEGMLRDTTVYGPPGYGEHPGTDERLTIPLLELTRPISTCGDSTSSNDVDSLSGIREIQLVLTRGNSNYQRFLNQEVSVSGMLSESIWSHDFTKVVLQVADIRLKSASRPKAS